MQPNTAASLAALGLALLAFTAAPSFRPARVLAVVLASFAAFIGGATVIQHITGANFGIDTLLVAPTWGQKATVAQGRMGPPAALCFLLIGIALLLIIRGRALGTARTLALLALAISLVSVCAYIYGAPALYSLPRLTGIAFSTALTLLFLCMAVVLSLREHEPTRTLLADSAAGMMARRALPVIVIVPFLIGMIRVEFGVYDEVLASTIRTVLEIIGLGVLMWWALGTVRWYESRVAHHAEELARALEQRTRELIESHEQLRRSETMAVLGSLSAGFGHDLSNIALPMRVRLHLLQQADLTPQLREHVDAVVKSMEYIDALGKRVRHYMRDARIGAANGADTPHGVDLGDWCREIEPFLRSVIDLKPGVTLRCEIPDGLTHPKLDKTGLTQAVYNLVQNAFKVIRASNTGQVIVISGYRNDLGDVCLRVEDDGPGLPSHVLATCTEFSATSSGSGLGLPLVKAFVDSHNGEMRVYSPPAGKQRGTAIVLRFPQTLPPTPSSGHPSTELNDRFQIDRSDDAPVPITSTPR